MAHTCRKSFYLACLFFWPTLLLAQPSAHPRQLIQLTRKSGYMFSGTVLKVERSSGDDNSDAGSVAITFHVDHGIRGTKTGQNLTIREWAGLWNSTERYRPGEHVFLFLYPPSRLGLTSPVSGDYGRLAIGKGNRVILPGLLADELPGSIQPKRKAGENHNLPLRQFAAAIRRASEE